MGLVGEAIERAVGEDGVVEESDPLIHRAVARDDRRRPAVPLDEDVVEIAGLLGGERAQAEVVQDEEIGGQPAAELPLEGIVGARLVQRLRERGYRLLDTQWATPHLRRFGAVEWV